MFESLFGFLFSNVSFLAFLAVIFQAILKAIGLEAPAA